MWLCVFISIRVYRNAFNFIRALLSYLKPNESIVMYVVKINISKDPRSKYQFEKLVFYSILLLLSGPVTQKKSDNWRILLYHGPRQRLTKTRFSQFLKYLNGWPCVSSTLWLELLSIRDYSGGGKHARTYSVQKFNQLHDKVTPNSSRHLKHISKQCVRISQYSK